jgi:hypothetical protein
MRARVPQRVRFACKCMSACMYVNTSQYQHSGDDQMGSKAEEHEHFVCTCSPSCKNDFQYGINGGALSFHFYGEY